MAACPWGVGVVWGCMVVTCGLVLLWDTLTILSHGVHGTAGLDDAMQALKRGSLSSLETPLFIFYLEWIPPGMAHF